MAESQGESTTRTTPRYFLSIMLLATLSLAASCTPATPPATSSRGLATCELAVDLLDTKSTIQLDTQGRLKAGVQLTSADSSVSLLIDKGARLLDKDGKPLQSIQISIAPTLPLPPENADIIGMVFEMKPQGATFNPPLKLTLSYEPTELPQGINESDINIAIYEDGKWDIAHYKQVDTRGKRIVTKIDRFAKYAILAPKKSTEPAKSPPQPSLTSIPLAEALASNKPTLAEFGWRTCIPCKAMKPILEELATEYQDKLNVVIIEVYEQRELTNQFKIMTIPTQILFDSNGKEVMRHIGLWPKEEVVAQLKTMGID